jgi:NADPH-dependent ferric siderophore reductase
VPHAGDIQDLATEADAEITWLVREEKGGQGSPTALEALRDAQLPPAERPYVWIAGESGCVKELRRHFVRERGIDRRRVTFVGYWRRGVSEEQLRAEG